MVPSLQVSTAGPGQAVGDGREGDEVISQLCSDTDIIRQRKAQILSLNWANMLQLRLRSHYSPPSPFCGQSILFHAPTADIPTGSKLLCVSYLGADDGQTQTEPTLFCQDRLGLTSCRPWLPRRLLLPQPFGRCLDVHSALWYGAAAHSAQISPLESRGNLIQCLTDSTKIYPLARQYSPGALISPRQCAASRPSSQLSHDGCRLAEVHVGWKPLSLKEVLAPPPRAVGRREPSHLISASQGAQQGGPLCLTRCQP